MSAPMDKAAVLAVLASAQKYVDVRAGFAEGAQFGEARAAVAEVYAQRDALVAAVNVPALLEQHEGDGIRWPEDQEVEVTLTVAEVRRIRAALARAHGGAA